MITSRKIKDAIHNGIVDGPRLESDLVSEHQRMIDSIYDNIAMMIRTELKITPEMKQTLSNDFLLRGLGTEEVIWRILRLAGLMDLHPTPITHKHVFEKVLKETDAVVILDRTPKPFD